jgi:hypothetical protein
VGKSNILERLLVLKISRVKKKKRENNMHPTSGACAPYQYSKTWRGYTSFVVFYLFASSYFLYQLSYISGEGGRGGPK